MQFDPATLPIVFYTREGHGQAGAEVRSFAVCRALRQRGVPANVVSLRMFHSKGSESALSLWHKLALNVRAFYRLFALRPKTLVLQRVNFHLPAALVYLLIFRPTLILDCDDWEFREIGKPFLGLSTSVSETALRFLSRFAKTTVVGSSFLENYLKPHARNIKKIPSGVEGGLFSKRNEKNQEGILRCAWTGSLDLRPETLEEILDLTREFVSRAHPLLKLWILARGEKVPDLEKHLNTLNCQKIRLFVSCSKSQVFELLSQCDVGLLPLFSDSRFNRAKSPVKLFEYFASGLIPVCANLGEASEIILHSENGFLVKNVPEMLQTLGELATLSVTERMEIHEKARELASEFSLERALVSWESVLQNSCNGSLENVMPKCFQAASVAQRP